MDTHAIVYEGTRLSLGEMSLVYRDAFVQAIRANYEHVRGTRLPQNYTPELFESWVARMPQNRATDQVFAILLHEDTARGRTYRYIGHMGIHHIASDGSSAVTGSVIPFPELCGKGYGTEAKLLVQYHAFAALGLRELRSDVKAFNAPSLGHLLACGYTVCGRTLDTQPHDGVLIEKILLVCYKAAWEPIWHAYKESGTVPRLTEAQRALVQQETS